ncbi:MAG: hypothetical protein ACI82H_001107 [Alphaproteobacteria bacterium]|jgi:hypothetical protein
MKYVSIMAVVLVLAGCSLPPLKFEQVSAQSMSTVTTHPNFSVVDVKSFEVTTMDYPNGGAATTYHLIPVGQYLMELVLRRIKPDPGISSIRLARFMAHCTGEELAMPPAICSGKIVVVIGRKSSEEMMSGNISNQNMGYVYSAHHGAQEFIVGQVRLFLDRLVIGAKTVQG